MIKISGTKLCITKGDSAYITLNINQSNGEPYELQFGDRVKVQVRGNCECGDLGFDGDIVISEDGEIVWHISPEDTADMSAKKKYFWDAQLMTSEGDVFTFIPKSTFKLLDEVTYND